MRRASVPTCIGGRVFSRGGSGHASRPDSARRWPRIGGEGYANRLTTSMGEAEHSMADGACCFRTRDGTLKWLKVTLGLACVDWLIKRRAAATLDCLFRFRVAFVTRTCCFCITVLSASDDCINYV